VSNFKWVAVYSLATLSIQNPLLKHFHSVSVNSIRCYRCPCAKLQIRNQHFIYFRRDSWIGFTPHFTQFFLCCLHLVNKTLLWVLGKMLWCGCTSAGSSFDVVRLYIENVRKWVVDENWGNINCNFSAHLPLDQYICCFYAFSIIYKLYRIASSEQ